MAESKISKQMRLIRTDYTLPQMSGNTSHTATLNGYSSPPSLITITDRKAARGLIASNWWVSSGILNIQVILIGSSARSADEIRFNLLFD